MIFFIWMPRSLYEEGTAPHVFRRACRLSNLVSGNTPHVQVFICFVAFRIANNCFQVCESFIYPCHKPWAALITASVVLYRQQWQFLGKFFFPNIICITLAAPSAYPRISRPNVRPQLELELSNDVVLTNVFLKLVWTVGSSFVLLLALPSARNTKFLFRWKGMYDSSFMQVIH